MMINCFVIDDEQPAINIIEDYINEVPFLHFVGSTINPVQGLSVVNEGNIDLVLLDIHMPYLLGTDFVKANKSKAKIIFTTAHDKYALEGYEMDVIDYLLKPIPFPRFLKAAQKAKDIFDAREKTPIATETYILLRGDSKGSYIKVELEDIDYVESTGNYVLVFCGPKKIIAHTTISSIEELLPKTLFMRVQKSFIVNISRIETITGNNIKLKNNPKADILIGNTYKEAFLETMRSRLADK